MPTVPRQETCSHLGCNNPRTNLSSLCLDHGGANSTINEDRYRRNNKYKTALWQRLRMGQLSRQPLCQSCLINGKVTQATDVDHVFPWNQLGDEAFINNIFQSLCKHCHASKTQDDNRGLFTHYNGKAKVYSKADYRLVMGLVEDSEQVHDDSKEADPRVVSWALSRAF